MVIMTKTINNSLLLFKPSFFVSNSEVLPEVCFLFAVVVARLLFSAAQ